MSENGCRAKEKKGKRDIEGKGRKRQAVFKKGRGLWEGCGVNHHHYHHHLLTHTEGLVIKGLYRVDVIYLQGSTLHACHSQTSDIIEC